MKIISQAHHDGHTALIELCKRSLNVHDVLIRRAEIALLAAKRAVEEFHALPWYKRWFTLSEWSINDEQWALEALIDHDAFLRMVLKRAEYELTIELDNREADIVFRELDMD